MMVKVIFITEKNHLHTILFPRVHNGKHFTTRSREALTSSVQHHATSVTSYIIINKMTNLTDHLPVDVFPLPTPAFR